MSDIPLREYVERIFDERQRALEVRLEASRREVDQTAAALRERLESMNEFRAQIQQERALYVQRDNLGAQLVPYDQRLRRLEDYTANQQGRLWALGIAVGLITTTISILLRFWR